MHFVAYKFWTKMPKNIYYYYAFKQLGEVEIIKNIFKKYVCLNLPVVEESPLNHAWAQLGSEVWFTWMR